MNYVQLNILTVGLPLSAKTTTSGAVGGLFSAYKLISYIKLPGYTKIGLQL